MRPLIEATEIAKAFGDRTVVQRVSFEVEPGSIFGLIGPSGCGKTTTIRMLTGVHRPTSGRVQVLGLDPTQFSRSDRERIGYLPQHFVLYRELSVEDNLQFVAWLYGVVGKEFRRRACEVLEWVELSDARKTTAGALSGGMQRRLGLAAALLHQPLLLFVDEPTAGIDPILRAKFWEGFRALRDQGRTIFLTTQYVTEVEYCDRVAVLREGKLVALGTPVDIRREAVGGEALELQAEGLSRRHLARLRMASGVVSVEAISTDVAHLVVDDAEACLPEVRSAVEGMGLRAERLEKRHVNFDEVFVLLMRRAESEGEQRGE